MTVLSEECLLALQAATAAACVEALNAAPPGELWAHVLAVVYPVIRAQAQKHMDRLNYIVRLPEELLVGIFKHLPVWDRVRAAAVCQRWRTVSLDALSLWSDIPHLRNVNTYEHLLERARDCPIALTYQPNDLDDLELFCWILSRYLGRIKSLQLILPERWDDDEFLGDDEYLEAGAHLHAVLSGNTPILESLVLSDPRNLFSGVYPSLPLLTSPMLRAIELTGFHLSYLKACVNSLTLHTLIVSPPDSPRLSQSLKHLYLRVHPDVFDAIAQIEDLSRLQTLDISFLDRHADVPWIVRPNRNAQVPWLADLLPFLRKKTVSAAVHFGDGCFSLLAADSAGRRRVFRDVSLVGDDWHSLLPNVAKLWLDAYRVIPPTPATAAAFPALEELTLGTTRPTGFTFGDPPSPVRMPLAWPPLSGPRLRAVRVVSETERQSVPAGAVLDYLARTCPRLTSLVFDGITLSPHPGAALDALADNVAMVQSPEVPQESYSVWAHPWGKRSSF